MSPKRGFEKGPCVHDIVNDQNGAGCGVTHPGTRLKIQTSYLTGVGKISVPYKKATEKLHVMQNLPNMAGIISGMAKPEPSPAETNEQIITCNGSILNF